MSVDANREVLLEGTWLYDGAITCRATIVRTDFDEEYYGDAGERPFLNEEGWQYYAEFEAPWGFHSRSAPRLSLDEAVRLAESIAPGLQLKRA